jgi:hypothetical protein
MPSSTVLEEGTPRNQSGIAGLESTLRTLASVRETLRCRGDYALPKVGRKMRSFHMNMLLQVRSETLA